MVIVMASGRRQVDGSTLRHNTFGLMEDKYGPIFTVKFGAHQVLVVNDRKIAQDCYTTNDKALAVGLLG
ncbi:hypothetical protein RDI58_011924 [Solanum bulbocastanum]|uniref:Uncharacterized protein n=1 Tax=Solanum bulbocastanum TaxID=147425 RepID=A0AAN8TQR5_SOLBU